MLKSKRNGECLRVYLSGEIDHCTANVLRKEIEERISDPHVQNLILDFSGVSFIDSSAIGMIIGRYKTMMAKGGSINACDLSEGVERLYRIAGLHRIIPITKSGGQHE